MKKDNHAPNATQYIIGFLLSIVLTLAAYIIVQQHVQSGHEFIMHEAIVWIVAGLAVGQLFVQLIFFLHLGKETKPRWNSIAFVFAAFLIIAIVFGSIWIMNNLNYNMMPNEVNDYLLEKEGYKQ
jgi:cytochrome o ubiquinol oxidase subunit IV